MIKTTLEKLKVGQKFTIVSEWGIIGMTYIKIRPFRGHASRPFTLILPIGDGGITSYYTDDITREVIAKDD